MLAAREQARVWEPCTMGQGMAWLKIPTSRCRWHACTCATSGFCCRLPGRRYVPTGRPRAQPASSAAPSVRCETDPSGPRRCGNQPVTRVHSATPNLTPARCVASVTGVTKRRTPGTRPPHARGLPSWEEAHRRLIDTPWFTRAWTIPRRCRAPSTCPASSAPPPTLDPSGSVGAPRLQRPRDRHTSNVYAGGASE